MKERVKTVYNCDFCNKLYLVKTACEKHELHCGSNPVNFSACSGCIHLKEKAGTVYYSDHNGEDRPVSVNQFECAKLGKMLYPHKVVKKGLLEKYPETFIDQEKMPVTCEHFLSDLQITGL